MAAKETASKFRFLESPSIAYEMARVAAIDGQPPLPLLSSHDSAPPSAEPWLASSQPDASLSFAHQLMQSASV